jgi:hypothetical protein
MTTNIQYTQLNLDNFFLDNLRLVEFNPTTIIPDIFRKYDKSKYNSYSEAIIRDQVLAYKLNNFGIVELLPMSEIKELIYKNEQFIRWTGMNFLKQLSILYNNVYLKKKSFCYPIKIDFLATNNVLIPQEIIGITSWELQNRTIREQYLGYPSPASEDKLTLQESLAFISFFYHPEYLLPGVPVTSPYFPNNCYLPIAYFLRFFDYVLTYQLLFFNINPKSELGQIFFAILDISYQVQNYVINFKQGKTSCFPPQYIPYIDIKTEYNYIQTLLDNNPDLINSLRNNFLAIK